MASSNNAPSVGVPTAAQPQQDLRHNISELHNRVRQMQETLRLQANGQLGGTTARRLATDNWTASPENPYSRIMSLEASGSVRQYQRIRNLSVMVVGCGGVGAAAADCPCRSGVGRIVLVDHSRQRVQLGSMSSMIF